MGDGHGSEDCDQMVKAVKKESKQKASFLRRKTLMKMWSRLRGATVRIKETRHIARRAFSYCLKALEVVVKLKK